MDKKDIIYVIAALGIILVLALVIKPIATGQPVNTGLSFILPTPTPTPHPITIQNTPLPTIITAIPTIPPTPVPTWDTKTKTVTFVDPATYGISMNQSLPGGTRINATQPDTRMTTYAIISGKYSGTTQVINIPFPYWELSYTVTPTVGPSGGTQPGVGTATTPVEGAGGSHSGIEGSYSSVFPVFSIQVMDAGDPNRIVRSITPPGGLDPDLWAGLIKANTNPQVTQTKSKYAEVSATPTIIYTDPRPWTERFYEGQRGYYFIINTKFIDSYKLDIKVPTRYIGKY